jgi:hypothetical protein
MYEKMTIEKYWFGILECYECRGECYLFGYPVNATLISLIPIFMGICLFIIFYYFYKYLKNSEKQNGTRRKG